ncbi:hypothetical protein F-VV57_0501 [Faustovirus]|nr:hypothetical protein F-VV57_0501 [Faustovirus]QJX73769.1 hypothetical protein F-VV63_0503 [Faustovirus]
MQMDTGALNIDIYRLITDNSWHAYRCFVSCNKTLNRALYLRDWRHKYRYTCSARSIVVALETSMTLTEEVSNQYYCALIQSPKHIFMMYERRFIMTEYVNVYVNGDDVDIGDDGGDIDYTSIKEVTRHLTVDDVMLKECINHRDNTILRLRLVKCGRHYLPSSSQTSRFEIRRAPDAATCQYVLPNGVEWSVEHPFFIYR